MSRPKPDLQIRKNQILTTTRELILRQGYEKTTFEDISKELGLSRASIYLCFHNKEDLFSAILREETITYLHNLVDLLHTHTDCDTLAGVFRSVILLINNSSFLAAIIKNDRRVFGSFLLKHPQVLTGVDSTVLWMQLLTKMQAVALIPQDVDVPSFAHLMSSLALGIMMNQPSAQAAQITPTLDELLGTFAQLLDRALPQPQNPPAGFVRSLMIELTMNSLEMLTSVTHI